MSKKLEILFVTWPVIKLKPKTIFLEICFVVAYLLLFVEWRWIVIVIEWNIGSCEQINIIQGVIAKIYFSKWIQRKSVDKAKETSNLIPCFK